MDALFISVSDEYAQLNQRCNRIANVLLERGVKPGDRVATLPKNSIEFVESYYAIAKIGAYDDELLFIMYTSGTTGHPKGVMHSHRGVLWAELTSMTTSDMPGDAEAKAGSCGKPQMHTEARVVDGKGNEVKPGSGEVGELILAGQHMMLGYWNKPEATADTLKD